MKLPAEMQLSDLHFLGALGHLCTGRLLLVSYTAGEKAYKTKSLHSRRGLATPYQKSLLLSNFLIFRLVTW